MWSRRVLRKRGPRRAALARLQESPELVRLDDCPWTTREHLASERSLVDALLPTVARRRPASDAR